MYESAFWITLGALIMSFGPLMIFVGLWLFINLLRWLIYRNDPKPTAATGAINGQEQVHPPGIGG